MMNNPPNIGLRYYLNLNDEQNKGVVLYIMSSALQNPPEGPKFALSDLVHGFLLRWISHGFHMGHYSCVFFLFLFWPINLNDDIMGLWMGVWQLKPGSQSLRDKWSIQIYSTIGGIAMVMQ